MLGCEGGFGPLCCWKLWQTGSYAILILQVIRRAFDMVVVMLLLVRRGPCHEGSRSICGTYRSR